METSSLLSLNVYLMFQFSLLFLFELPTLFYDGLIFIYVQPYFPSEEQKRAGTNWWSPVRGERPWHWVPVGVQYEIRTWVTGVGSSQSHEKDHGPGGGCLPPSSRNGPGKPQASFWTIPGLTQSPQQVSGKFTVRRHFEADEPITTCGPSLDSDGTNKL